MWGHMTGAEDAKKNGRQAASRTHDSRASVYAHKNTPGKVPRFGRRSGPLGCMDHRRVWWSIQATRRAGTRAWKRRAHCMSMRFIRSSRPDLNPLLWPRFSCPGEPQQKPTRNSEQSRGVLFQDASVCSWLRDHQESISRVSVHCCCCCRGVDPLWPTTVLHVEPAHSTLHWRLYETPCTAMTRTVQTSHRYAFMDRKQAGMCHKSVTQDTSCHVCYRVLHSQPWIQAPQPPH